MGGVSGIARVWGFRGLGFTGWGLGFRVQCSRFQGSGLRASGLRLRLESLVQAYVYSPL